MAKKYAQLRSQLSPEAQARAAARAESILNEMARQSLQERVKHAPTTGPAHGSPPK